jgi:hypothetical protein
MCLRRNLIDVLSFYMCCIVLLVYAAVASIIKSGEHMVEGKVVGVQNACAEDLKEFSGGNCKHERCIVVQLSGNKQTEPAFYHFESDEYGGSEIHFYAVNSRTKKMLLQFDNSDGNAQYILA